MRFFLVLLVEFCFASCYALCDAVYIVVSGFYYIADPFDGIAKQQQKPVG